MRTILTILLLISVCYGQRIRRNVTVSTNTYSLYIDLPPGYNPANKYPLVMFATGVGEIGSDSTKAVSIGPSRQIGIGNWDGIQTLGDSTFGFIVVTWQQPLEQFQVTGFKRCADTLKKYYSINPDRVYATGLSLGSQTQIRMGIIETTDKETFISTVDMSSGTSIFGETLDSLVRYNRMGGKFWYLTGVSDGVAISEATMAAANPWCYSASTSLLNGHGGWNNCYIPTYIFPNTSYNCYQLMLLSSKAPYASAGQTTINTSSSSVTLNGITNQYPTGWNGFYKTVSWTKTSGGSATITNSDKDTTTVTGLTPGTYTFRLRSQNGGGDSRYADQTVTVNVAAVQEVLKIRGGIINGRRIKP